MLIDLALFILEVKVYLKSVKFMSLVNNKIIKLYLHKFLFINSIIQTNLLD